VVALGLPGPDLVTTALELFPMWALFEGSIWLAVLVEHRRRDTLLVDRFQPVAQPPE
jgi:Sec-independent protein secretion pathway component TatC